MQNSAQLIILLRVQRGRDDIIYIPKGHHLYGRAYIFTAAGRGTFNIYILRSRKQRAITILLFNQLLKTKLDAINIFWMTSYEEGNMRPD